MPMTHSRTDPTQRACRDIMVAKLKACLHRILLMLVLAAAFPGIAQAANDEDVRTAWRLLDYIAVDYRGAVERGGVKNPQEYAEMVEFSRGVETRVAALPESASRGVLLSEAKAFSASVARKDEPAQVAAAARSLGTHLLAAYPVSLAPAKLPDLTRGAALFAEQCATCHGVRGGGDGPAAAGLDPRPVAFTDIGRARERSVFALYQVIDQGLDGTAMRSFRELPSQDRWALAFYTSQFAFTQTADGEKLWQSDPAIRKAIPDMTSLSGMTPAALAEQLGRDKADAVTAFLRRHPEATLAVPAGSLSLVRKRLTQSLAAYEAGDRAGAAKLALSAYLDGFEPVEPVLAARDSELMGRIETEMGRLRASIGRGDPPSAVKNQIAVLDSLFANAEDVLGPGATSTASTFIGAFTILLREGVEALLIVVAMIAFLRKADRGELVRHVHIGWIAALAAGGITWAVATFLIGVSGASRELTEGFGSLFAAIVLLTVGIWMHGKSQVGEWQRYIDETLGRALTTKSAWFLFGLAFLVVYREVFETILFYAALTAQGSGAVVLAGAGAASLLLAVLAWLMLRFSARLPVSQFFQYSSALLAVLAVVLVGKGIAALQEAGMIGVSPLEVMPRIPVLGIFPSWQPMLAQVLVLAVLVWGAWYNDRRAAQSQSTGAGRR